MAKREAPLGDLLRQLRQDRGWTQDDLAARVTATGVPLSASQVTHVETGRRTLSLEKGQAVADVFGLEGDDRHRLHFARARQREVIQDATATPESTRRLLRSALRSAEARYEELMQELLRLDAVGEDPPMDQEVVRQALYSEIAELRAALEGSSSDLPAVPHEPSGPVLSPEFRDRMSAMEERLQRIEELLRDRLGDA